MLFEPALAAIIINRQMCGPPFKPGFKWFDAVALIRAGWGSVRGMMNLVREDVTLPPPFAVLLYRS